MNRSHSTPVLPAVPGICAPDAPRWSKEQIRAARKAPLPRLLRREGFALRPRGHGNFELLHYGGILVKDAYWRHPGGEHAGNTIDLFVQVLGRTFNDAMRIITQQEDTP